MQILSTCRFLQDDEDGYDHDHDSEIVFNV